MRKYTEEHEWIDLTGSLATVGITNHAQEALGDVVFVDLPKVGRVVKAGEAIAVVESVKAASDVYAPLDGTITEINPALAADSSLINSDAEGAAWFFKISLSSPAQFDALLDKSGYDAFVKAS